MKPITEVFQIFLGNIYLKFLLFLAASFLVALLFKLVLRRVLKPLAKKTKTKIDDLIIKSLSSVGFYFVLVLGIKMALQLFTFKTSFYNSLADTILIFILVVLFVKIIDNFSKQWLKEWKFKTKTTADERLIPFLQKFIKGVIIVLAIIFVFSSWKINISPLLTAAGIVGLAIGLAVKDSLANVLGGLQLVLDKAFKVGDKVKLESGELGVILDIGLRSTKLKTYDNEVIYIPNGYLANAKIKNYTQPDLSIRVNVEFGVVYGSDAENVRQVVLEALKKIDTVLAEPEPEVVFVKMSDFSLDFIARAWVASYTEAYSTWLKMTDEIYRALGKAKISIPFPTRTVYTKSLD